ncbi:C-type lectin 37Da isoform X3 [Dendroctonus ponderosae]|uniref:C-type lectin domain-containing protein n=1 Tax=Dendroctonus ponderosae TaxID=77166 RepID=A0AAR5PJA1_DENPD|nr:C-type lectin 37Da isoform X3 [Dendroctonus ponderosae]
MPIKILSALLFLICAIECIIGRATLPVEQSNVNYVVSTLAVSWKDAFVLCEQSGMELVSITSAKEQNAVAEALSSYPPQLGQSNFKYVISTVAVPWKDAFVLCKQSGMELVSITSAEEQNAVADALSAYPTKQGFSNGYWTSGTRFNGNSFVWFTSGKPLVYTRFADKQPDNAGNNENCIEFFMYCENSYKWNDRDCSQKAGYICQERSD